MKRAISAFVVMLLAMGGFVAAAGTAEATASVPNYKTFVWQMPSWGGADTATWPQDKVSVTPQSEPSLDVTLPDCGYFQVDTYKYGVGTEADRLAVDYLASGVQLTSPNHPAEPLISGGWGVAYKVVNNTCEAKANITVTPPTCDTDGSAQVTTLVGATLEDAPLDQSVGSHRVTFTANYGYRFSGDKTEVKKNYTIKGKTNTCEAVLENPDVDQEVCTNVPGQHTEFKIKTKNTPHVDYSVSGLDVTATTQAPYVFSATDGWNVAPDGLSATYTVTRDPTPDCTQERSPVSPSVSTEACVAGIGGGLVVNVPEGGDVTYGAFVNGQVLASIDTSKFYWGDMPAATDSGYWEVLDSETAVFYVTLNPEGCEQQPKDKVTHTDWVDGDYKCGDTTVTQTRETTTTAYIWAAGQESNGMWVLDEANSKTVTETQKRDLKKSEQTVCPTPTPTPPPPTPTCSETSGVSDGCLVHTGASGIRATVLTGLGLALLGSLLIAATRKRGQH